MMGIRFNRWPVLVAVLCAAVCISARAQDDPPERVARLNFLQGTVSFRPADGGDNDWVAAVANRPLTIGDRLWTDMDGRAELHVGSTAIRVDHNTGMSVLNLSDNTVQLQLSAGSMIVRLRRLDPNDSLEVDAPNLAFSLLKPGDYRVDVDPDMNVTTVTVWQGQGEITGSGRTYQLISDQRGTFAGTDTLDYQLGDPHSAPQSEFDNWAATRDRGEDHVQSARYVSPDVTGSEDLDPYGTWRADPEYGNVWVPTVTVGWAPYRFGHWVWVAPWGWTWVEDEPWGFAPFHYGRWVMAAGVWGWVPGPLGPRPVYAPALVAWVGGGPGFTFSASFGVGGGVAWFPLGPREVFVPAYYVSDVYVTRVNVTNTVVERTTVVNAYHNVNVTNVTYVNQHVTGGVTAVSRDTFVNARPVGRNVVVGQERELAAAPVSRSVAVQPAHASFVGAGAPATARPPAAIVNRTVVAKRTPPPAVAGRFNATPNAPAASGGSAGRPPAETFNRPSQPTQPNVEANQTVQPSQPNGSFRPPNRTNEPGGNAPGGQPGGNPGERNGANSVANSTTSTNEGANVKQAPPVRPATPGEQQQDEERQRGYQQQHDKAHPNQTGKNDKNDKKK